MVDQRRRKILKGGVLAMVAGGAPVAASNGASMQPTALSRRRAAMQIRDAAARQQLGATPPASAPMPTGYVDARDLFSKGLAHDSNGNVLPSATMALGALRAGRAIPLADGARPLNNPFSGDGFSLAGADPQGLPVPLPPAFASAVAAAEMIELYWFSLIRDVPLHRLGDDEIVAAAQRELVALGLVPPGASAARLMWQGLDGPAGLPGPAISQFLLQNIPYGPKTVIQTYPTPVPGQAFLTRLPDLLAVRSGAAAGGRTAVSSGERHLLTGRDIAEYVHQDFTYQAFLNAALIIMAAGDVSFADTELSRRRTGCANDILIGDKSVLALLGEVSLAAQKAAFFHKWTRFNRLRPEELGLRVAQQHGGDYAHGLPTQLMQSDALRRSVVSHGSAALAQAYPEGCPLHPSYPSAHAVNAGACGTILKAFFAGDRSLAAAVEPADDGLSLRRHAGSLLTVADEIDKLVINIAVARSFAGVHFRSDNVAGIALGEQVALALLQDHARTIPRGFSGFEVRCFDGRQFKVTPDYILPR